jgi:hypothetical protein
MIRWRKFTSTTLETYTKDTPDTLNTPLLGKQTSLLSNEINENNGESSEPKVKTEIQKSVKFDEKAL